MLFEVSNPELHVSLSNGRRFTYVTHPYEETRHLPSIYLLSLSIRAIDVSGLSVE